jgi:pimeloyl-ACP methyl ester carboxylesterase
LELLSNLNNIKALSCEKFMAGGFLLHIKKDFAMGDKPMNGVYIVFKILMWVLILLFAGDLILQTISYGFYKGNQKLAKTVFKPQKIQISEKLSGYGYNLSEDSDHLILCFGGSKYIAYNTVGMYSGYYGCPFLSVDYYGTQDSRGTMNLKTMQKSAENLFDWARQHYPGRKIVVIGHSYGCGMAAYLASVRNCSRLILVSGYRTSADMYNRILPFYWGFLQNFIKNNIRVDLYAKHTTCPVTVIGSDGDATFSAALQKKLANCYPNAEIKIFHKIKHEDYLTTPEVIAYIKAVIQWQ